MKDKNEWKKWKIKCRYKYLDEKKKNILSHTNSLTYYLFNKVSARRPHNFVFDFSCNQHEILFPVIPNWQA